MSFCGGGNNYATDRDPSFEFRQGQGVFLLSKISRLAVSPPSHILVGTGVLSQGLKWSWRDVDHSPPSDEAKHEKICTSPPPICLHCVEMGKFTVGAPT